MIQFLSDPSKFIKKENAYLSVREKEGRVLSDEILVQLPDLQSDMLYYREWKWRAKTAKRLLRYLDDGQPHTMLDLGCGNGWLAHKLAGSAHAEVTGVDLNCVELEQADRVFTRPNLQFVYTDVLENTLPENHFDRIVCAASIQYFPDFHGLISALRRVSKPGAELHIVDSPFYKNDREAQAAKQRTVEYYAQKNVPEMANYYHHHVADILDAYTWKNKNGDIFTRFLQKIHALPPFPWIQIRL